MTLHNHCLRGEKKHKAFLTVNFVLWQNLHKKMSAQHDLYFFLHSKYSNILAMLCSVISMGTL